MIDLITFYDQEICPVDEGRVVDVAYLGYRETHTFTVSHSILLEKLAGHSVDKSMLC